MLHIRVNIFELLIYSPYSLGLDTYIEDPICKFKITNDGYGRIGRLISEINLRTLFVMEGLVFVIMFMDTPANVTLLARGYHLETLGKNVHSVLSGFSEQV